MDKDSLRWEAVKTEHLVQDEWIDFRRVAYRLPDGNVLEPFYTYSRRSYVVIVATDEEGRYICVSQYRFGIDEVTTEFVAGGIECDGDTEYLPVCEEPGIGEKCSETKRSVAKEGTGDSESVSEEEQPNTVKAEDPLEAAKRELREESGYVSDEWEHLLTIPSNATISDNYAYIFRAKNCRKEKDQELDDCEFLAVETHTKDEMEELIGSGNFQQAMHVMAYLLAEKRN